MSTALIASAASAGAGKELVGVLVAVASAALYDIGYVLEKQALTVMPPVSARPLALVRTVSRSRRWLGGFVAMLAGLGLQVIALTMAPVSVVQPVLAAGLVCLVVAGGPVLGERLGWRHKAALVLVLAAVVSIALSSRSGARLAGSVPAGRFAEMAVPVILLAAAAAAAGARSRGGASGLSATRSMGALAVAAGLLYGLGAVAEKAVAAEIVGRGLYHGALAALGSPYPWLFVVVTAAGLLVFQVALQRHAASLVATLSNVVSSVCALAGASVVFGELLLPSGWWSLARVSGFACVGAALVVIGSIREESDVEAAIT